MGMILADGLTFALPLFVIAIGGIYSERSGITNLALEGFLGFGAFTGALTAVSVVPFFPAGSQIPMYLALVAAAMGGMLYSMLHGLLCIRFQANQVISGIVINILAAALTTFLTSQINQFIFGKPSNKFLLTVSEHITIPGLSRIPAAGVIFQNLYPYEIILCVVALAAWYVLYQTRTGLRLRACGENPHAVAAAGVNVEKIRFLAVMASGGFAGLGGMCYAYSLSASFSPGIYTGFGYLAIAGLIFGNWKIGPTLGACLLFGMARSGGYKLIEYLKMPISYSDLVMILPYVLTLILLAFFSKNSQAPKALGEIYDKGKR